MNFKTLVTLLLFTVILISGLTVLAQEKVIEEDELAGVKLGFSTDQVEKILGIPPAVEKLEGENPEEENLLWEYQDKGIRILFKDKKVEVVILEPPCSIATPRGLKIGDSWKESLDIYRYCSAYIQNMGYEIGIIYTLDNGIRLSVAIPSDSEEIYKISIWREKSEE